MKKTSKSPALKPVRCSALLDFPDKYPPENQKLHAYLIDINSNSFIDEVTGEKDLIARLDFYTLAVNKLIKDNGGIKPTQQIRFSLGSLPMPDSVVQV
jgi:hypothetical protein